MSAADEPELTSSTNSFVAAPVTPVENSLILSPGAPPPPPPPPGTHDNTAWAEASYDKATVPVAPPAWQAMPLRLSSEVTPAPAGPCGPAGPWGPAAPCAPAGPGGPVGPAGPFPPCVPGGPA